MFHSTVVQMTKMLRCVDTWLVKATENATQRSFDPHVLLGARLAPDQFQLMRQLQSACDSAKFTAARAAGKDAPRHEDNEQTLDEIRARIAKVVAYLETFSEKDFEGADSRIAKPNFLPPGKGVAMREYVEQLNVPNFYFHVTTTYAILRHNGVPLGKTDFLGDLPLKDI